MKKKNAPKSLISPLNDQKIDNSKENSANASLFLSQEILQFAFNSVSQRIYLKDKNRVYFSANKQFLLDLGMVHDSELIGKTDKDLIWKDYENALKEEDEEVLNGTPMIQHKENYLLNGKMTYRLKTKLPLKDIDGNIIGIFGTYEELTEVIQYNQALQESESKYRGIFNNSHSPMLIIDPIDLRIIDSNSAASSFYGYPIDHLKTMNILKLYVNSPENIKEAIDKAISNEQNIFYWKHLKNSGELIDVELHSGPLTIEGKTYIFSIVYDISEKNQMIDELKKAKFDAEQMNKLKSIFLANMSHELRTPLVGILGYSQILMDELEDESAQRMANSILRGGNRLLQTLNLILDLSRIEANRMEIKFINCNVADFIKEVCANFNATTMLKGLYLNVTVEADDVFINIDEMHFTSILNNLINNAIKFTEKGGITVRIRKQDENVLISIQDTGIGIPEEKQSIVFEAFRQASEGISRNFEGTGLGLTLTKKFVELMNGSITMESQLGSGTTFTLSFPITHTESKEQDEVIETDIYFRSLEKSNKRILIVEDDFQTIDIIKTNSSHLYTVDFAMNSNEAFEKLTLAKYNLILMDINLGKGLCGIETMQKIKQMPDHCTTPIVAVTAFAMKQDVQEFLRSGFIQVLTKPFTKSMLLYTIQKYAV